MTELVLIANSSDGTISTLRLSRGSDADSPADSAELEVLATSGDLPGCGTFAVDGDRGLVYAAYKDDDGSGIATLRLDRESGELTEVARRPAEDKMTYLALAHGGSVLLGAGYGGGVGLTWPVTDGEVGEPVARIEFANLHCVVSDDEHAYFVSLGDDLTAQYALASDGTLAPLDPPTVAAPEGSGPRHLVLEGDDAYLVTEFSGQVIRLTRGADGTLSSQEAVSFVDPEQELTHSRFGADPLEEHLIWGADVAVADGVVLASERTSSLIGAIRLEGAELGEVVGFTPVPQQPRGFRVTDDGRYVVAVGERSQDAALLEVGEHGHLTQVGTAPIGNGANWVRILA
ncbi:lactonase family protein [Ornithinimicrobium sp. Y1847]|uniref:lactonase family protein n=1 Tax=Ornithinimicrobium sp. Y1847 TaxID=3405419 RepID=UPI003B6720E6